MAEAWDMDDDPLEDFDTEASPEEELEWRDTYFVLFHGENRPTLGQVEGAIQDSGQRLLIEKLEADDDGMFASIMVQAPEDNAALEISFESGESVLEQTVQVAEQIRESISDEQLATLLQCNARLDVMHFEKVGQGNNYVEDPEDAEFFEALDPGSLLMIVEALASLTNGLAVDPASGGLLA